MHSLSQHDGCSAAVTAIYSSVFSVHGISIRSPPGRKVLAYAVRIVEIRWVDVILPVQAQDRGEGCAVLGLDRYGIDSFRDEMDLVRVTERQDSSGY